MQGKKLRESYYKLVQRILVSKKELHLHGISDTPDCRYCGQPDSLGHAFIKCNLIHINTLSWAPHFNPEHMRATNFVRRRPTK